LGLLDREDPLIGLVVEVVVEQQLLDHLVVLVEKVVDQEDHMLVVEMGEWCQVHLVVVMEVKILVVVVDPQKVGGIMVVPE
jgi:hypothetical protein